MEKNMRKWVVSGICTLVLMFGFMMSTGLDLKASDSRPMLDGSYLTNETESTGTATGITRGEHLQIGYSKIRKLGPGLIYAGGTTIGQRTCESVKVAVIVERAKWEDKEWEVIASWQKENADADLVSSSKKLEVEGGWYYRVKCIHSANGDVSDSSTDGLYVEVP
jgi:hypothetical protein